MLRTILIASLVTLSVPVADAAVVAVQSVEKEIIVTNENGTPQVKRVKADAVAPGEEVIYTLSYRNEDDESAEAMVLVMPVPEEISYIEGSVAGEGSRIAFSADKGATYVGRGRLTVVEDGAERPAKSNEITHIKWTLSEPLAAGASGTVSFRGVLK